MQIGLEFLRRLVVASCAAMGWNLCSIAAAEEPAKDAAQAVGEGNAARWLDYYRRERGQQWESKSEQDHPSKEASPPDSRDHPATDPPQQPDRR